MFHDPVPTHIGLALITHQLGYFDILPLYVVLMVMAPGFAIIDRYAPQSGAAGVAADLLASRSLPDPVPTWPVEGQWFFNPLAWQLIFVLGFVMAREDGARRFCAPPYRADPLDGGADRACGAGLSCCPTGGPTRPRFRGRACCSCSTRPTTRRRALIQFLALIALYVGGLSLHPPVASKMLVNFLSMLGRNSLYVFCVGSILSLPARSSVIVYQGNIYDRHRRGNLRRRNHGTHSMASRMARRRQSQGAASAAAHRPEPIGRRAPTIARARCCAAGAASTLASQRRRRCPRRFRRTARSATTAIVERLAAAECRGRACKHESKIRILAIGASASAGRGAGMAATRTEAIGKSSGRPSRASTS